MPSIDFKPRTFDIEVGTGIIMVQGRRGGGSGGGDGWVLREVTCSTINNKDHKRVHKHMSLTCRVSMFMK